MISSLFFIGLSGFFLCYHTSKRAQLHCNIQAEKAMQNHPKTAQILGCILLLISLIGCVLHLGIGSGIMGFLVVLMTAGSLLVILAPTGFLSYKVVIFSAVISIIIEIIFS